MAPEWDRRDRYEYLLTERGLALVPVIGAPRQWGRQWTEGRTGSTRGLQRDVPRNPRSPRAVLTFGLLTTIPPGG